MTWQATTEDKWLCSHILAGHGVNVPETLAVIDKSERSYPATRRISTVAELRHFMKSQRNGHVFGKENRGICSFGAFQVEDADDAMLNLKNSGPISYQEFLDGYVGDTPYLLQASQTNHPFFADFTESLATVRVAILLDKKGIKIPFCILKLPARGNIADSFWRPGNLACNIDPATGAILSVRSKDAFGTTDYERHPETDAPMLGKIVPMWDRVIELVHTCAPIFQPVRYQSMDIAITQDGPVLIELNTGGGWDLLQLGSGQGFLTDDVVDFFRSCGYPKV
jgi:hypothetical protein